MQYHIEASDPAAMLGALGLRQQCVAELFAVGAREIRKWRRGDRPIPRGVQILLRLLASGVVTIEQIAQAAAVDTAFRGRSESRTTSTVLHALPNPAVPSRAAPPHSVPGSTLADPDDPLVAVDSDLTVAEKLCRLADNGECKWPSGDVDDPAKFEFCRAPALVGAPYCADHLRRAYRVRPAVAHRRVYQVRKSRETEPELDQEDSCLLARARACDLATMSVALA